MSSLRVSAVTRLEELRRLEPMWQSVSECAETPSPFLSHPWVVTWWEHFGTDRDLNVLVVEDDEGVAGIAPLTRTTRCGQIVSCASY